MTFRPSASALTVCELLSADIAAAPPLHTDDLCYIAGEAIGHALKPMTSSHRRSTWEAFKRGVDAQFAEGKL